MSTVYLAVQKAFARQVALKVMSLPLPLELDARNRFFLEGRTLAKLNHHHIVTTYDIGSSENRDIIATQYIGGRNLRERIQKGLRLREIVLNIP